MNRQTLKESLFRILAHRRLAAGLVAVALLLVLPSIWTGWQMDDFTHRYFLLGNRDHKGETVSALDIFAFVSTDPVRTREMKDLGLMPWWTLDSLRLSFFRPLTALTHWLDYTLWPNSAVLMHVQSLIWFAGLVAAVALLYRRFLGSTWIAGLAALFYAVDDAHGLIAGWLAARNTVLASLIGVLVIIVHDRWRRGGWEPGALVAPLLFALGLCAGEFVLGSLAYLFAYTLFLDPLKSPRRMLTVVPYGLITALWLLVYRQLGYGTYGSGYYVDPLSEPGAFVSAFIQRGPILLLDQFGFPPADVAMILTAEQMTVLWLVALGFLSLLIWLFLPLIRGDPTARFWATGLGLSLVPIAATLPSGRLLSFAGVGAMGLIAQWIEVSSERGRSNAVPRKERLIVRAMTVFFLAVHLVLAPMFLPLKSVAATFGEPWLQQAAETIPSASDISQKDVIFVNPPRVFFAAFTAAVRILNDQPLPQRFRSLASGSTTLRITRTGERSLSVRPEGGFLADPLDQLYRGLSHTIPPGTIVTLRNMTVRVVSSTPDGRPAEAIFEFPRALEDSSLMFLRWDGARYAVFDLPAVGSGVDLPPVRIF